MTKHPESSMSNVELLYEKGLDPLYITPITPKTFRESLELIRRLAQEGDARCQNQLGCLLYTSDAADE